MPSLFQVLADPWKRCSESSVLFLETGSIRTGVKGVCRVPQIVWLWIRSDITGNSKGTTMMFLLSDGPHGATEAALSHLTFLLALEIKTGIGFWGGVP